MKTKVSIHIIRLTPYFTIVEFMILEPRKFPVIKESLIPEGWTSTKTIPEQLEQWARDRNYEITR